MKSTSLKSSFLFGFPVILRERVHWLPQISMQIQHLSKKARNFYGYSSKWGIYVDKSCLVTFHSIVFPRSYPSQFKIPFVIIKQGLINFHNELLLRVLWPFLFSSPNIVSYKTVSFTHKKFLHKDELFRNVNYDRSFCDSLSFSNTTRA